MPTGLKTALMLGALMNMLAIPVNLVTLATIWLAAGEPANNLVSCSAMWLTLLFSPSLIIWCCMRSQELVAPRVEANSSLVETRRQQAARRLASLIGLVNSAYRSFWTTDNRIGCALLTSVAFATAACTVSGFEKKYIDLVLLGTVVIAVMPISTCFAFINHLGTAKVKN